MEYASGEGVDWRRELEQWIETNLGHTVFNPNRESERYFSRALSKGQFRELKKENIDRYTAFVRDLINLDTHEIAERSDYIICYWDSGAQRGAGTTGEVTIARFTGKPVYLVTSMEFREVPGWILGCATKVFSSFDELKSFLLTTYEKS